MSDIRIGFIGLGGMGAGMASRLAESGFALAVYNRTAEKAEPLAALGARVAESPADAAADADVVMLSLADETVVATMVLGDDGVFSVLRPGGTVVDLSTVSPAFAHDLSDRARRLGFKALDACVYGAPMHARSGELRVMVGGDEGDFLEIRPILSVIGKDVTYLGASGMGATMKIVLNMLMGVQMPALAEAIVFGERAGLSRESILKMIAGSGYASPVMSFRCAVIGRRSFDDAAFKLGLMSKDMNLALAESHRLGVPMPVAESAQAALAAAAAMGLADLDVAAIVAAQERLSGIDTYAWPGAVRDEGER